MPAAYTIDTERPTHGRTWREDGRGNRYASATLADGRRFFVGVQRNKRVRIPFKPRGTFGWTYYGFVNDHTGRTIAGTDVAGSIGVRGLLRMAYLIGTPPPTTAQETTNEDR